MHDPMLRYPHNGWVTCQGQPQGQQETERKRATARQAAATRSTLLPKQNHPANENGNEKKLLAIVEKRIALAIYSRLHCHFIFTGMKFIFILSALGRDSEIPNTKTKPFLYLFNLWYCN